VIVDDSGSLVGTVRAHEVLSLIESADRPDEDLADAFAESEPETTR
jgi:osmoprotectant transport system ATP-binding protein